MILSAFFYTIFNSGMFLKFCWCKITLSLYFIIINSNRLVLHLELWAYSIGFALERFAFCSNHQIENLNGHHNQTTTLFHKLYCDQVHGETNALLCSHLFFSRFLHSFPIDGILIDYTMAHLWVFTYV